MIKYDTIVIGASAGGVNALTEVARGLPRNFPAAVFIVMHVAPHHISFLPEILSRAGMLPATHAVDHEAIEPGRIYLAPPDRHLLVEPGVVRVVYGPKENWYRPSVDVLFRSAAHAYGSRVVGVVLTGALNDGAAGLVAVKARGGIAVVEDPEYAASPQMPLSAMQAVKVDYCLPTPEIAPLLVKLAHTTVIEATEAADERPELKPGPMELDVATENEKKSGHPAVYTCPECNGTLWEIHDDELIRFRCRVGHGFSAESLLDGQTESLERALWIALRVLEERASLEHKLAAQAHNRNFPQIAKQFEKKAQGTEEHAQWIRKVLQKVE